MAALLCLLGGLVLILRERKDEGGRRVAEPEKDEKDKVDLTK